MAPGCLLRLLMLGSQVEGIAHVIKQLTTLQIDPNLDQPQYTVLKKVKEYEIRKYDAYLVAETDRPMGKGPAAGDGFQELAGYIFGGNNRYAFGSRSGIDHTSVVQNCETRKVPSKLEVTTWNC